MPKKAAYALAMRGDLTKKLEIIRGRHLQKPKEIVSAIQEIFPLVDDQKSLAG